MKRKKQPVRKCAHRACVSRNQQSLVLGLLHDLWFVVKTLVKIVAWPCRALARAIHKGLKQVPIFRHRHAHAILCIAIGLSVLGTTFAIEHLFTHAAWSMTVETMRAAGVCPIWEALAAIMKLSEDFV